LKWVNAYCAGLVKSPIGFVRLEREAFTLPSDVDFLWDRWSSLSINNLFVKKKTL